MTDRLTRLETERDRLTRLLDSDAVPVPLVPQYVGQLAKLLEQIEACEKAKPQQKGTVLDELAKRRGASGSAGSSVGKQRRS